MSLLRRGKLGRVYVVALAELATPIEDEAAALAAHLGTTLYEERLNLNGGLPAIVLRTADRKEAATLLAAVRSRGHGRDCARRGFRTF